VTPVAQSGNLGQPVKVKTHASSKLEAWHPAEVGVEVPTDPGIITRLEVHLAASRLTE
jgi:hypothetical protein